MSVGRPVFKINTIHDVSQYAAILTPGDIVNPADPVALEEAVQISLSLLAALQARISVDLLDHPSPAYLAANQVGIMKRILLLQLPKSEDSSCETIFMLNPSFEIVENATPAMKYQYAISTFFADQFRFCNDLYASEILVKYTDLNSEEICKVLTGKAAIAAQMGIDWTEGQTPFDRLKIEALLDFASRKQIHVVRPGDKIATTRGAYIYQDRIDEISDDTQFAIVPDQVNYIAQYARFILIEKNHGSTQKRLRDVFAITGRNVSDVVMQKKEQKNISKQKDIQPVPDDKQTKMSGIDSMEECETGSVFRK